MTKAPAGAMQRLSYSDPHLEPYMYVRIVGIPCTLHVLEHGSSSYHTTHTSMPRTSAYSTYSMYLILEADTVEEVHCEASPLLGLVPNLNLITVVRMMYTKSALGGHRSTYALDAHQQCCAARPRIAHSQLFQSLKAGLKCIQQKGI